MVNSNFWKNKKVFLTGHTGFKGSWMSLWLIKMGAILTGYSKDYPTNPNHFKDLKIEKNMKSILGNICDFETLKKSLIEANPDIVIHMAAQPLVRYSYAQPIETYMTNVIGTVNTFEACRQVDTIRAILNVTSDKCYENKEQLQGYVEDDPLGGFDPYSSSKGCAELVGSAYRRSFLEKEGKYLASARAGNVIGGGDWALDRIVPDIIRSVLENKTLSIRNPKATRPWQHVLEPIAGYLILAEKLFFEGKKFSQAYNFGPLSKDHCSVISLIEKINQYWLGKIKYQVVSDSGNLHEAGYLSLDCAKAHKELDWIPKWNLDFAIGKTVEWAEDYRLGKVILDSSLRQIECYEQT